MVVAAGVGVGVMLRRSDLFGGKPPPTETPLDDGEYLERPTVPTDGVVRLPVVTSPGVPSSKPTTNLEWEQGAIAWLTASQNVDGTVAASAIGKYMQGAQLTAQEAAALSLVIRHLGSPPEGAPPPIVPPPTSPPPGSGGGPQSTTPGAVTGLTWSANRVDISFAWTAVPGAAGYRVDLIQGASTLVHSTQVSAVAKPGWRVQSSYKRNLAPNHPYRLRVWAVSSINKAGPASTIVARTDP